MSARDLVGFVEWLLANDKDIETLTKAELWRLADTYWEVMHGDD